MTEPCEICELVPRMNDANPYFVGELKSGFVVLGWNQIYPGYTLFLSKHHAAELHEISPSDRATFLTEMSVVAEAVFRAFSPRKLNYEMLGNSVAHMHWHLFPRYADDPNPQWPVWSNAAYINAPRKTPIEPERLAEMRDHLRSELSKLN
jgi:diadenosine tetraphosphate (Ap4A) HIT family hydrolase